MRLATIERNPSLDGGVTDSTPIWGKAQSARKQETVDFGKNMVSYCNFLQVVGYIWGKQELFSLPMAERKLRTQR